MSYLLKKLAAEKLARTEERVTRCRRCGAWQIDRCHTPFCRP